VSANGCVLRDGLSSLLEILHNRAFDTLFACRRAYKRRRTDATTDCRELGLNYNRRPGAATSPERSAIIECAKRLTEASYRMMRFLVAGGRWNHREGQTEPAPPAALPLVVAYTLQANHVPLNARIIGANEHESHFVFDVLFNNATGILPAIHSTDPHGTNHVNFALLYLFAPRYRNVRSKVETGLYGFRHPRHYKKGSDNQGCISRTLRNAALKWPVLSVRMRLPRRPAQLTVRHQVAPVALMRR
jgi:hypothetical protein